MNIFKKMKRGMEKLFPIKKISLLSLALIFVMVSASYADIKIVGSPLCMDLMAGKNTDAGNVCVEVSDDLLLVIYTTSAGWELTGAHFWVGADLADIPQNKKGNPKIGHFPYHSGDITGKQMYYFAIPLTDLGVDDIYELCDQIFFAAAHATLRIEDGYGGYRTETGWASGSPLVSKGNWAMYFYFQFVCENIPPVLECETAFAYGDKALWDILDPNGNPITDKWGWQNTVHPGDRITRPLYVGATQNDPNNGTYVGYVYIAYSGSMIIVEYITVYPYTMSETNLYVGTGETNTADPGQFGNSHVLQSETSDEYHIKISGDPVFVVPHAMVCKPVTK
jgi:hypothetical protein